MKANPNVKNMTSPFNWNSQYETERRTVADLTWMQDSSAIVLAARPVNFSIASSKETDDPDYR